MMVQVAEEPLCMSMGTCGGELGGDVGVCSQSVSAAAQPLCFIAGPPHCNKRVASSP